MSVSILMKERWRGRERRALGDSMAARDRRDLDPEDASEKRGEASFELGADRVALRPDPCCPAGVLESFCSHRGPPGGLSSGSEEESCGIDLESEAGEKATHRVRVALRRPEVVDVRIELCVAEAACVDDHLACSPARQGGGLSEVGHGQHRSSVMRQIISPVVDSLEDAEATLWPIDPIASTPKTAAAIATSTHRAAMDGRGCRDVVMSLLRDGGTRAAAPEPLSEPPREG
ncbi:hypothetical protein MT355_15190 [Rathayibacter sp. VKM Ac-2929]|nr:hypothetical protein [Rathayibacter sp. VKM Ac-2929]